MLQLLRARRYFNLKQLLTLYKSHVLGLVEYRTPALYHASASVLAPLDKLQEWVLRDLGLTELEALEHFNLAPLRTRRDIAMLGVVWRAVHRKGPRNSGVSLNKRLQEEQQEAQSGTNCN